MDFISIGRGIFGLIVLLGIAFLFSNNKKKIDWKLVGSGITLQFVFAILIIKGDALGNFFAPFAYPLIFFRWVSSLFVMLLSFTTEGAVFVFGNLAKSPGSEGSIGVFFAFQVLPTIIFFASITSILYYLGIMQKVVQAMAWVMLRIMGTSGAESLSCTANIFIGQTEAPLMVKPYIKNMTNSELLTIMVGGMATIAGGVMAAYIQILGHSYSVLHNVPLEQAQLLFATHLIGASFMAAPAALLISKIIYPETNTPETKGKVKLAVEKNSSNVIEAAAAGAGDGLHLALNVAGMLIAFIALIALVNYMLQGIGYYTGLNTTLMHNFGQPLNLQLILGFVFQLIAMAIGVPTEAALQFGSLFGTKIVLNEFVAYVDLGNMITLKQIVNQKAIYMATYALCGFANFSSIAIQIGGLSPMAPNRRADIAKLGLKAVLGGSLATLMTATLAGILF
ncbi:MAG: nucleoside transporter C-terminal domain-containing protein [bacterium]